MKWLYYIQQRCSITSTECAALLCIIGLFLGGRIVQAVRDATPPFDESFYAEIDEQFRQGVAVLRGEAIAEPGTPTTGDTVDADLTSGAAVMTAQHAGSDTSRRQQRDEAALGRMNLNAATSAQLQRLRGIGPALAGRIIDYRNEHGPFKSVSELTRVRGIGPKTLENIEAFLFVDPDEE